MTDAFIETFLANYDDNRYPAPFLEQYEMLECLANNEFGETFLIKDRRSGKKCIAKCYFKNKAEFNPCESEFLRKLNHRGLPEFIDDFENLEIFVMVRSYVPGVPLSEFVSCFQPNKELFLSIGDQICEILAYLHQQTPAIIHRDIKPQNIIIDRQGKVKLIDLGISRTYDDASHVDTSCLGTRDFAAPEQYGYSQTDHRTDIFSLGILLAWLLTGESNLEKAKKSLPNNRLTNIILKCTAFDPNARYQNVNQVKDALAGRDIKRKISILSVVLVILLLCVVYIQKLPVFSLSQPDNIDFQEPTIEEAVRLTLGKDSSEKITEEDLLSIETLRLFGNQIALDDEALQTYTNLFVNNDESIQRGEVTQLDDLRLLQNLRHITLIYQNITNIDVLSELPYLEDVDLRHNPIEDVSSLAGATELSTLSLFGTVLSDLTPLRGCERLSTLDLGSTLVQSFTALEGLDSLTMLCIRRTPLQSLDGILNHPSLQQIHLSETNVNDFSLLLELPNLQFVHVGEEDRNGIIELGSGYSFTVIYD